MLREAPMTKELHLHPTDARGVPDMIFGIPVLVRDDVPPGTVYLVGAGVTGESEDRRILRRCPMLVGVA